MTSKRYTKSYERPVNRETFIKPWPEVGLIATNSPLDPRPSLTLADGRVVEMDGVPAPEFDLLDRFIAFVIIIMVCIGLLAYCTPAPAAGFDQYEADRRADARQEEADRRADERMQRAEDAANLREFQRRMDADGREFSRRYEAVGTERDPYYHRRRY